MLPPWLGVLAVAAEPGQRFALVLAFPGHQVGSMLAWVFLSLPFL